MAEHNFKVIYRPEGGSKQEWSFSLESPDWDIKSQTERITDWTWKGAFVDRLLSDSAIAMQALLWVLRKRQEPRLQLDSVRPNGDEVSLSAKCDTCSAWVDLEGDDADEHGEDVCGTPAEEEPAKAGKKKAEATPGEA